MNSLKNLARSAALGLAVTASSIPAVAADVSVGQEVVSQDLQDYIKSRFYITSDNTLEDVVSWFENNRGVQDKGSLILAIDQRIDEKIQASNKSVGRQTINDFKNYYGFTNNLYLPFYVQKFQRDIMGQGAGDGILGQNVERAFYEFLGSQTTSNVAQNTQNTVSQVIDTTPIVQNTQNTLDLSEKIETSMRLMGEADWDYFVKYFNIKSHEDYQKVAKSIPASSQDLLIGPNALKYLYVNHYSKNINSLPQAIRDRWDFYKNVDLVYEKRGDINNYPGAFSNKYFYGKNPTDGGYIDPNIENIVENFDMLENNGNSLQVKKIGNEVYIVLFEAGKLQVATKGSIARDDKTTLETNGSTLKRNLSTTVAHISGTYDGAPMPYAMHYASLYAVHTGNIYGGSAGCIRVPGKFAQKMHQIISKSGQNKFKIYVDVY